MELEGVINTTDLQAHKFNVDVEGIINIDGTTIDIRNDCTHSCGYHETLLFAVWRVKTTQFYSHSQSLVC
jgi:hypothetical protein